MPANPVTDTSGVVMTVMSASPIKLIRYKQGFAVDEYRWRREQRAL